MLLSIKCCVNINLNLNLLSRLTLINLGYVSKLGLENLNLYQYKLWSFINYIVYHVL